MARKGKKEDIPRGSPAWMSTYGDMITLVLTFFILLFSFSSLDVMKWEQVVSSMRDSLGVIDGGRTLTESELVDHDQMDSDIVDLLVSGNEIENFQLFQEELVKIEILREELSRTLAEMDDRIIIDTDERGIIIRFQDRVLFESGSADIRQGARGLLAQVAELLKDVENPIRIEGHTDNVPINTLRFPSNWELSTSRATNVLRILIEQEIEPSKLSAVGYGEYRPLLPNTDSASRQQNRRVDIIILKNTLLVQ